MRRSYKARSRLGEGSNSEPLGSKPDSTIVPLLLNGENLAVNDVNDVYICQHYDYLSQLDDFYGGHLNFDIIRKEDIRKSLYIIYLYILHQYFGTHHHSFFSTKQKIKI